METPRLCNTLYVTRARVLVLWHMAKTLFSLAAIVISHPICFSVKRYLYNIVCSSELCILNLIWNCICFLYLLFCIISCSISISISCAYLNAFQFVSGTNQRLSYADNLLWEQQRVESSLVRSVKPAIFLLTSKRFNHAIFSRTNMVYIYNTKIAIFKSYFWKFYIVIYICVCVK